MTVNVHLALRDVASYLFLYLYVLLFNPGFNKAYCYYYLLALLRMTINLIWPSFVDNFMLSKQDLHSYYCVYLDFLVPFILFGEMLYIGEFLLSLLCYGNTTLNAWLNLYLRYNYCKTLLIQRVLLFKHGAI